MTMMVMMIRMLIVTTMTMMGRGEMNCKSVMRTKTIIMMMEKRRRKMVDTEEENTKERTKRR